MPTFNYTNDIPFSTHNPSTDQPDMLVNTNSIDSIINVDHYSFEQANNDGWHKQSTYVAQSAPTTASLQGAVYTKDIGAGVTQLFYRRESNGTEIQLTGPGTPTFGATNGYTFLAGGLLLQWGSTTSGLTSTGVTDILFATSNINFPSNCFNVTAQMNQNVGATFACAITTVSNTGFRLRTFPPSTPNGTFFYWMAIGN